MVDDVTDYTNVITMVTAVTSKIILNYLYFGMEPYIFEGGGVGQF